MPERTEVEFAQELLNMKLNDEIQDGDITIQKVFGGWIYWKERPGTGGGGTAGVFVPYSEESTEPYNIEYE